MSAEFSLEPAWVATTARAIAEREGVPFKAALVEAESGGAAAVTGDLPRSAAALADAAQAALQAEVERHPMPRGRGPSHAAATAQERALCVQVAARVATTGAVARCQRERGVAIVFEGSVEEDGRGAAAALEAGTHTVLVRGLLHAFEAFAEAHAMPREHYPPRTGRRTAGTVGWDTIVLLYFVHHVPQLARLASGAALDAATGPMVRSWRRLLVALQSLDAGEAPEHSRRRGALALVNGLAMLLFQRHRTQQCDVLLRGVAQAEADAAATGDPGRSVLAPSAHMTSEVVAYHYHRGRLELYRRDAAAALAALRAAYRLLPPAGHGTAPQARNKSRVRFYLAVAGLAGGRAPPPAVLESDPALAALVAPLAEAMSAGDPRAYEAALEARGDLLRRRGVYVLLQRATLQCHLRLLARVHAALGRLPGVDNSRVTLAVLAAALGGGASEDDCALWVTRLIAGGHARGYLSYEHRTIVLSKKEPFPQLIPAVAP